MSVCFGREAEVGTEKLFKRRIKSVRGSGIIRRGLSHRFGWANSRWDLELRGSELKGFECLKSGVQLSSVALDFLLSWPRLVRDLAD